MHRNPVAPCMLGCLCLGLAREDVPVELALSELRAVEGVLWPHLVTVEAGGRITGHYAFERVEFNAGIDPQIFEEPE